MEACRVKQGGAIERKFHINTASLSMGHRVVSTTKHQKMARVEPAQVLLHYDLLITCSIFLKNVYI